MNGLNLLFLISVFFFILAPPPVPKPYAERGGNNKESKLTFFISFTYFTQQILTEDLPADLFTVMGKVSLKVVFLYGRCLIRKKSLYFI